MSTLAVPDCAPEPPPKPRSVSRCDPTVQVYRQDGGTATLIEDGDQLTAGDRIQFCFSGLPTDSWLSIAGRDSTDDIGLTHHWSTADSPGSCTPFSLELDDIPGPERIWITVHPEYPDTLPAPSEHATFTFAFPKAIP